MKWRTAFAFVFVVVCSFCFPVNAGAQVGYCYNTNYSSYTSISVGSDTSITQTVQVSGHISLNNPAVWGGPNTGWIYPCTAQNNQMQGTSHTFNITNLMGSIGGNYSQGPTPALNYNTYSISVTSPATPGTDYGSQTGGVVVCPFVGNIFNPPPKIHTYSIRLSAYIFFGLSNGRCTWVPSCAGKCSSQHTTNTVDGLCFTTGPYKQCADLLQDGNCWEYRTFCYGKPAPGICTN
jgi:hypothetical protein